MGRWLRPSAEYASAYGDCVVGVGVKMKRRATGFAAQRSAAGAPIEAAPSSVDASSIELTTGLGRSLAIDRLAALVAVSVTARIFGSSVITEADVLAS